MDNVVEEWKKHWNAKANIKNDIEINGYCINGHPMDETLYFEAIVKANIDLLDIKESDSVLEVGCGSGLHLYEMEKITKSLTGVDLSEELLKRYNGKAKTIIASADKLPFEDKEKFDRILMNGVALYFPNFNFFKDVVKKLIRLLKDDGILLIGDMLSEQPHKKSKYMYFSKCQIVDFLDKLGYRYSVLSQNKLKRTINERFNILIYKD